MTGVFGLPSLLSIAKTQRLPAIKSRLACGSSDLLVACGGYVSAEALSMTASATAKRGPYRLLVALMLASFFSFADRNIFNLLVPAIEHDLGISDTQISLLQGLAFALFYSVMAIPFGWAVDRVSRRNLIIAGMTTWCSATVLCGLADSFAEMFVARMLVGLGEATLIPAGVSMIADSFPAERRGRMLGFFTAALMTGSGAAQIFGGFILQVFDETAPLSVPLLGDIEVWQAAFLSVGLPGFLVVAFLFTVHEPERGRAPDAPFHLRCSQPISFFQHVWQHKATFIYVFGAYAAYTYVSFGTLSWGATLFIRNYGLTSGETGVLMGTIALVGGAAGTIIGGMLGDFWTANGAVGLRFRLPLIWAFSILPVSLGYTLSDSVVIAAGAYFVMFFIQSICYGSATAVIQDCTPSQWRGLSTAVWYLVTGLAGYTLGPVVTALLTDHVFYDQAALPYSILFMAIPGVILTIVLTLLGLRPFERTRAEVMRAERLI